MLQESHHYTEQLPQFEVGHFIPPVKVQRELKIDVHHLHSKSRSKVESFVLNKFQNRHSATIREYMPLLIDLGYDQDKSAAIGIRPGINRPFFLENYLDDPIELTLKQLAGAHVNRQSIVEIGNFAADNVRLGSLLFTLLAKALLVAGYEWMVFTATDEVERMINKLGCEQTILTDANASMVQQSSSDWGSYYDNNPKVIACNLRQTISKAETNTRLNRVFLEHTDEVTKLGSALRSIGTGAVA